MSEYVDKSKVYLQEIDKKRAKRMIVENHYSHRFSSCRYAIGIFHKSDSPHPWFADWNEEKLIGCMTYGYPVGRTVMGSIFKDENILQTHNILELTRLFIHDGYGKNVESLSIGLSFKWLKKHDENIKVLISYADPDRLHLGGIYKATNWIYQGAGLNLMPNYSVSLTKEPYDWIHSRTVSARFGSHNVDKLREAIGETFWRRKEPEKHRYLYFLGNKKENKMYKSNMKHEPKPYPTDAEEYLTPIEEINV
jgi:hypothetical protein|tara:strand:+ start:1630 stop:2382 length:753 start_codon:yes stop_codon:yes gene_type:complete